jgi:hypothetical protein
MSYRLGRRDLRLPSADPDWRPDADLWPDLEPDPAATLADRPADPAAGPVDLEPIRAEAAAPPELVAGATARLWALLDAYPQDPDPAT